MKVKIGDLIRHTTHSILGVGLVTGIKEGSSGVFVSWLKPAPFRNKATMEVDLMLEVINESR